MLPSAMRSLISRATIGVVGVALLLAAYGLVRAGRAIDLQNERMLERLSAGGASTSGKQPPGGVVLFVSGGTVGLLALPFLLAAVVPFSWYERLGRPPRMTLHENTTLDEIAPGPIGRSGFGGWF